jgi:MmyB-like transcription regulator ligand binding domain
VFLHPAARDLFDDWDNQIRGCIGYLRALAATEPDAPDLASIVGELLVKSPDFARLWERYDVRGHSHGRKTFHHPDVGDITFGYQGMALAGTPGQHLITYYAEQGTAEYDALVLLDHLGAEEATPIPARQDRS